MSLTINSFEDLLKIIETRPEWRRKLVKTLFPEVDLPKALQELAVSQSRMEDLLQHLTTLYGKLDEKVTGLDGKVTGLDEKVTGLDEKVTGLDEKVTGLDEKVTGLDEKVTGLDEKVTGLGMRVSGVETEMKEVKHTLGDLKGKSHESLFRDKAAAVFGRFIRRGRNMVNEIADQLHAAEETGKISMQEFDQVMAADLLWGGKLQQAEGEVIMVVEASWVAELMDVERAITRANILRNIGFMALPVVAGQEWTKEAEEAARGSGVVITTDGRVDHDSWQNAFRIA